jgi:hypothetical protein
MAVFFGFLLPISTILADLKKSSDGQKIFLAVPQFLGEFLRIGPNLYGLNFVWRIWQNSGGFGVSICQKQLFFAFTVNFFLLINQKYLFTNYS